jgi:hypothetical protein
VSRPRQSSWPERAAGTERGRPRRPRHDRDRGKPRCGQGLRARARRRGRDGLRHRAHARGGRGTPSRDHRSDCCRGERARRKRSRRLLRPSGGRRGRGPLRTRRRRAGSPRCARQQRLSDSAGADLGAPVLGDPDLELGRHDRRRNPLGLRRQPFRGAADGAGGARIDREHLLVGRCGVRLARRLRCGEGRPRSDHRRQCPRAPRARSRGSVALARTGSHRAGREAHREGRWSRLRGRRVSALYGTRGRGARRHSGRAHTSRSLADEYGFTDVDGTLPKGPMHERPKGIRGSQDT